MRSMQLLGLLVCAVLFSQAVVAAGPEDNFPASGQFPAGWVTTPGANNAWTVASDTANGGSFSLKSGALPDDPTAPSTSRRVAAVQAGGVFSGGTVSFAYRTSSEAQADFLQFYIDGALMLKVSGAVDWKVATFPVSAGAHVFKWVYDKDASFSDPVDAVWIDTVVLPAGTLQPLLSVTRSGSSGTVFSSPAGIKCGVSANCSNHFATNSSVTLTAATLPGSVFTGWSGACSGTGLTCVVSMSGSKNVVASFAPADDGFPAGGNALPQGWSAGAGSNAAWRVTTDSTNRGAYSLKSGVIGDNGLSAIQFTSPVGAGTVDFSYRVSSEAYYDLFTFSIDDVVRYTGSGEVDWTKVSVPVTAGTHVFKFAYRKDAATAAGSDAAWIDSVVMPAPASTQRLNVTGAGIGAGSVISVPSGIDCGVTCSATFATNSPVTLTATPAAGSAITVWSGACSGSGTTCQLTMGSARDVRVMFWIPGTPGSLDIDANSAGSLYDPMTDGVLLLRYLFGMSGPDLTSGALGATATRADSNQVMIYLDSIRSSLDVDGNGMADSLTDGLLILRYMLGLRGTALIANVVGSGATRTTAAQIEGYIRSLMP